MPQTDNDVKVITSLFLRQGLIETNITMLLSLQMASFYNTPSTMSCNKLLKIILHRYVSTTLRTHLTYAIGQNFQN